jgi:hypothetical protein
MFDPLSQPFPQQIVPLPPGEAEALLMAHQLSFEFYEEVRFRAAFEEYCQWYQQTAERHRQELEAMRNDINLRGWLTGQQQ